MLSNASCEPNMSELGCSCYGRAFSRGALCRSNGWRIGAAGGSCITSEAFEAAGPGGGCGPLEPGSAYECVSRGTPSNGCVPSTPKCCTTAAGSECVSYEAALTAMCFDIYYDRSCGPRVPGQSPFGPPNPQPGCAADFSCCAAGAKCCGTACVPEDSPEPCAQNRCAPGLSDCGRDDVNGEICNSASGSPGGSGPGGPGGSSPSGPAGGGNSPSSTPETPGAPASPPGSSSGTTHGSDGSGGGDAAPGSGSGAAGGGGGGSCCPAGTACCGWRCVPARSWHRTTGWCGPQKCCKARAYDSRGYSGYYVGRSGYWGWPGWRGIARPFGVPFWGDGYFG